MQPVKDFELGLTGIDRMVGLREEKRASWTAGLDEWLENVPDVGIFK
jgi:hypothetical protein